MANVEGDSRPAVYVDQSLVGPSVDEALLWCWIALAVARCDNDFASPAWRKLHPLGRLDFRWPIYAACYVFASSGFDTSRKLADLLSDLALEADALVVLRGFARDRQVYAPWLGRGRGGNGGPTA